MLAERTANDEVTTVGILDQIVGAPTGASAPVRAQRDLRAHPGTPDLVFLHER